MKKLIFIIMAAFIMSCGYHPDPYKLTYPYKSYDDIVKIFDQVGRQNPVKYEKVDELYYNIEFSTGQKYRITGYTKGMICKAMPQHC